MNHMWEIFERLDEMVYVTNIATHELVYMNQHLRQALGYDEPESHDTDQAVRTGVEALRLLIARDRRGAQADRTQPLRI